MSDDADVIAALVLDQFDKLPKKRKPSLRSNGLQEWVPLSGIVARVPDGTLYCLALATGMKCLPSAKLPEANGVAIHDWHAEVLALRAFNLFVLQECRRLATSELDTSMFLQPRSTCGREDAALLDTHQPFTWREGITLHMYCSEAPCGDASMELTMAAQEDASPWDTPAATSVRDDPLPGRAYFSQLGIVRRKPARGDAPPCLSKSCSDKIALKQGTSLLSALTSLLVAPTGVYLSTLILPASQYSAVACERAFTVRGRMQPVAEQRWDGGYAFCPVAMQTTEVEFVYSRRTVMQGSSQVAASNMAVAWTLHGPEQGESMVGGVLQGVKQFAVKGASLTSRRRMWQLAKEVSGLLSSEQGLQDAFQIENYAVFKEGPWLLQRKHAKEELRKQALAGWVRNTGDEDFTIT